MKTTAASSQPIPRCPPMIYPFNPVLFQKTLDRMSTQQLVQYIKDTKQQMQDPKMTGRLQPYLDAAKAELKSRRGGSEDAQYKAQLRKMSDAQLKLEWKKAEDAVWCSTHGIAYIPSQVEAAQHRAELIQAEASRRGLSLPRAIGFE